MTATDGREQGARLRLWWLALAALAVQVAALRLTGPPVAAAVVMAAQAVVLAVLLANPRTAWLRAAAAGLGLNLLVMLANGGAMPIPPETLARTGRAVGAAAPLSLLGSRLPGSKDVVVGDDEAMLAAFGDRFVLAAAGHPGLAFSAGDALLLVGLVGFGWTMATSALGRSAARADQLRGPGEPAERVIDLVVGRALIDPAYEAWLTARAGLSSAGAGGAGDDPHAALRRLAGVALSRTERVARPGTARSAGGPGAAVLRT